MLWEKVKKNSIDRASVFLYLLLSPGRLRPFNNSFTFSKLSLQFYTESSQLHTFSTTLPFLYCPHLKLITSFASKGV